MEEYQVKNWKKIKSHIFFFFTKPKLNVMKIGFWVFETCSKRGPFTDIRVAPFQFEEKKLQDLTDESSNISENWFLCKKRVDDL